MVGLVADPVKADKVDAPTGVAMDRSLDDIIKSNYKAKQKSRRGRGRGRGRGGARGNAGRQQMDVSVNSRLTNPVGKKALKRLQTQQQEYEFYGQQGGMSYGMYNAYNMAYGNSGYGVNLGQGNMGGHWSVGMIATKENQPDKMKHLQGHGNPQRKVNRQAGRGRGGGRGRSIKNKKEETKRPTAEELDAELDAYIKEVNAE